MQLKITNNSVANAQTLDLSSYVDVQEGHGLDPQDPKFSNRIFARSLLRPGATLALTQLTEKELIFPLILGPVGGLAGAPTNFSSLALLIQQINGIIETPGATLTWMPDGASQPTTFDGITGALDVLYSFRKEQAHWTACNLRFFSQPLGRMAGPRPYAAASAVGPLLMISPYASSGAQAIGATTQAGVAGWGGQQQGASSGVFYPGSPSLAGDGPAQLQISYVGPLPNTATNMGMLPYAAVSLLPDANYRPLITAAEFVPGASTFISSTPSMYSAADGVAGQFGRIGGGSLKLMAFSPAPGGQAPTLAWAGNQRLLAIARASNPAGGPFTLYTLAGPLVSLSASVTIQPGDWGLYDLGTFSLRPSEYPSNSIFVGANAPAGGGPLDVTALIMLPDNATWFLNAPTVSPSQYGMPIAINNPPYYFAPATYTNTLLLDETLPDQFIYAGQSQTFAPSPTGSVPSSSRITQFTRGLVPTPDPKNGLPIIAFLGVGQNSVPTAYQGAVALAGASWANPQNQRTMAQVNVVERARYVLP